MNDINDLLSPYLATHHRLQAIRKQAPWLKQLRAEAYDYFAETGYPTTRDEEWKYTSVSAIEKTRFQPANKNSPAPRTLSFGELSTHQLVFVNGHFAAAHSTLGKLPAGVHLMSLPQALAQNPYEIEPNLGQLADYHANGFTALNTALWEDGAYIYLAPGTTISEPVSLLFVTLPGDQPFITHPRNLIVAGENSRAMVIERHMSLGEGAYFTNAVTEIAAGPGAQVEHIKLQEESRTAYHVSTIQADQQAGSRFVSHAVSLGALLARTDINCALNGVSAECTLNGLYLADGRSHVDYHTRIDHAQPGGVSRELYKGILDGHARGVFSGKVIVHQDAQKSDAQQASKNLLLSQHAEVDAKPQLEIYADDVKCSHGATVGQIDENMIFYLRSRGIDEVSARSLLTYAFAVEMLNRIPHQPLRHYLEGKLMASLPQGGKIKEFLQ